MNKRSLISKGRGKNRVGLNTFYLSEYKYLNLMQTEIVCFAFLRHIYIYSEVKEAFRLMKNAFNISFSHFICCF